MFPEKTNRSDFEDETLGIDESERVYAIGDIHGRYDLLLAIFKKISDDALQFADARKCRLIFMGDYIDRGDQSREVIEALSDLYQKREKILSDANFQIEFLAGNHEAAMLAFLDNPVKGHAWLKWGGIQTMASFGISPVRNQQSPDELEAARKELLQKVQPFMPFLSQLKQLSVSGRVVFVHAGLDPDATLNNQPDQAALWGRTASGKPLGLKGFRTVHGHFAEAHPVSLRHRVCVDTGAYHSGRLTAVRLDHSEAFLQVVAAK